MSDSIWAFLVRNLGGRIGESMPGLDPSTNIATHPIQNPAPAIVDPTAAPTGPITGPVGPTGPMMLDRDTGRPTNEPPASTAPPGSQADPWEKVKQAGAQLGQIGAQRPPMSPGMAAPQIHRGQPMNLIEAVFGINKRQRDY